MSGKIIATIYFYLVSAGALILIVIGVFNAVNFVINSTQYEKYPPLYGPSIANCDEGSSYKYYGASTPAIETVPGQATPSAEDKAKAKMRCEEQLELDRRQHRVDDIKHALTFTIVGAILFGLHFPQAKKRSN